MTNANTEIGYVALSLRDSVLVVYGMNKTMTEAEDQARDQLVKAGRPEARIIIRSVNAEEWENVMHTGELS